MKEILEKGPRQPTSHAYGVLLARSERAGHGVYLGRSEDEWHFSLPQQSVLVLGPPRSGKTSALIIPNVLASNGPVVSTSTKSDVLDATWHARSTIGRCLLFDPTGSVRTPRGVVALHWSPLEHCRTWDRSLAVARSLVEVGAPGSRLGEASHWTERAQALLAPLLHAAALEGADMRTVLTWVDRRKALPAQQILASGTGQSTELARNLLDGLVATDERELSGIWSTTSGALTGFRSEHALQATSRPNFSATEFVASSDTIYVAAPAHRQALAAPLVVGLIDEVAQATYEHNARRTGVDIGAPAEPPVLLALDEVANIAPLPELPSMISEGGGQGVVTLACLQDLSQARHRWGARADGFASLFGTTVVLPGIGDVATLEALSSLAGEEEIPLRSVSSGRSLTDRPMVDLATGGRPHVTESVSTLWKRRLPVDLLARGVTGRAVAFDHRNRPGWFPLTPAHIAEPWRTLRGLERELDATHSVHRPSRNEGHTIELGGGGEPDRYSR
ncbi:MAG: type IV secretory system conjugative DNA transfer family protein [Acidimicrobiales bacterium]